MHGELVIICSEIDIDNMRCNKHLKDLDKLRCANCSYSGYEFRYLKPKTADDQQLDELNRLKKIIKLMYKEHLIALRKFNTRLEEVEYTCKDLMNRAIFPEEE